MHGRRALIAQAWRRAPKRHMHQPQPIQNLFPDPNPWAPKNHHNTLLDPPCNYHLLPFGFFTAGRLISQ